MKYKLFVEQAGEFVPALTEQGEQMTFEAATLADANDYLAAMQAENGKCFSAEKVREYEVADTADAPDGQQ